MPGQALASLEGMLELVVGELIQYSLDADFSVQLPFVFAFDCCKEN
jgi:hypothetical protein